jgi:hypothetical protein
LVAYLSDHYAGALGLVPDTACVTCGTLHKKRIASPTLVPFQARVRLHSDQRIAALSPDKRCAVRKTWIDFEVSWRADSLRNFVHFLPGLTGFGFLRALAKTRQNSHATTVSEHMPSHAMPEVELECGRPAV